jgi:hypothetical protein
MMTRLGLITLIGFITGLWSGSAQADESASDDGAKWRFTRVLLDLASMPREELEERMAYDYGVRVELLDEGLSTVRRFFTEVPDEDALRDAVWPILRALSAYGDRPLGAAVAPLPCDDFGVCQRTTSVGELSIRLIEKRGAVRILSMRYDAWYEGCGS